MIYVLYRLVAELAAMSGIVAAAFLAYHDKSPWVWGWFLLYAFVNIITGPDRKTDDSTARRGQHGARVST